MGDVPPQSSLASEYPTEEAPAGPMSGSGSVETQSAFSAGRGGSEAPANFPQQFTQQYGNPQHAFSSQFDMAQPQGQGRGGPYNMNAMMNALPQANYRSTQYNAASRPFNATVPSANVGQMPPVTQFAGQAAMAPMSNQQFYLPQHAHMAQYYAAPISPSQQQANMPTRPGLGYYPGQVVMNNQQTHPSAAAYYYSQPTQFPAQAQSMQGQILPGQYISSTPLQADPRLSKQHTGDHVGAAPYTHPQDGGHALSDSRSSVVRGPPRKPKQSGHAIWIGNLPPQTDLMSLVHHVCKEANGLESLFLISKSNCAFANFKDEQTCVAAQQKLHDSKFQSVRLVSRLRKSTVEGAAGVTAPTGPAASTTKQASSRDSTQEPQEDGELDGPTPTETTVVEPTPNLASDSIPQKDRFFILKSLTVEDLELSVRTGIWATQSHNEETLNEAFKAVDNVYLVFSANKSGEYFGYARMVSPINEDPAAAIEFAPKAQTANDMDLPRAIPTESTEFAPKGRIIDDSARGTIFWEAEREEGSGDISAPDSEEGGSTGEIDDSSSAKSGQEGGESKAWGKPFKLEWLSTTRLPFYRTRGLRNPWNSNREVKIARDGTELESSVGRRLIGLFNRVQSPIPGQVGNPGMGLRPTMAMIPGYPPMRSPYQ